MSPDPAADFLTPELKSEVERLRDDMDEAGAPYSAVCSQITDVVVEIVARSTPPQHRRPLLGFLSRYLALLSKVPE